MKQNKTDAELLALLKSECDRVGSQREWGRQNGFSAQFVNDVSKKRRGITKALAAAVGYAMTEAKWEETHNG